MRVVWDSRKFLYNIMNRFVRFVVVINFVYSYSLIGLRRIRKIKGAHKKGSR